MGAIVTSGLNSPYPRPPSAATDPSSDSALRYGPPRSTSVDRRRRPAMRKDAQRNREQILAAAKTLVQRKGEHITVAEIVNVAGVKTPTLYRHFGSKEGVLKAVYELRVEFVREYFEAASAQPNAWDGARMVIDKLLAESRDNAFTGEWPSLLAGTQLERLFIDGWTQLIQRGHDDGTIRADFSPNDIPYLVSALLAAARAADYDPTLQDRYVSMLLEGLRPDTERPLVGKAPSMRKVRQTYGGATSRRR
jgi:AcrR family transcriptional regulator